MPLLSIRTNQPVDPEAGRALTAEASRLVAERLGKPERYVMVALDSNTAMLFGGSDAPLAYLELKSIGLPAGATADLSADLCGLLDRHLGVAAERIYIEFADAQRHMWGWNGGTF